jgi:DNA-binding winged helix-turn-helix (wHTH) protein
MADTVVAADIVRFGPFRLDLVNRLLARDGEEVALPPRAMGVLWLLVSRAGDVVSKQQLLDEVWKDAFVSDTSLAEAVSLLRQVLGDDPQQPVYIQTLPRRGYRFVAEVLPARDPRARIGAAATQASAPPAEPLWTPWLPYLLFFVAGVAVGLAIMVRARPAPAPPRGVVRLSLDLAGRSLAPIGRPLAITRRGDTMALVLRDVGGVDTLALRGLDGAALREVADSEGASSPFFSPDGRSVGFFARGRILRVSADGGVPSAVADAPMPLGAAWTDDDTIVFAARWTGGLQVVPATGGTPRPLTTPDASLGEIRHAWPDTIPGSASVLFTAARSPRGADPGRAAVVNLRSGEVRRLNASATDARALPLDHALLSAPGASTLVPVDPRWTFVTGSALALPDRVRIDPLAGGAALAISGTGVRMALEDPPGARPWQWLHVGAGTDAPVPAAFDGLDDLAVSPDGRRVAGIERHGSRDELWAVDLSRATRVRTLAGPRLSSASWSPDGMTIAVATFDGQASRVLRGPADAAGAWTAVPSVPMPGFPSGWTPDGRQVLLSVVTADHGLDIRTVPVESRGPGPGPGVGSAADEMAAALSPNGRWLAYQTNEAGRWAVAVRAADGSGGTVVVSGEGRSPAWTDERTLVFVSGTRVMRTSTSSDDRFDPDGPVLVVDDVAEVARGVTVDGRILVQRARPPLPPSVTLEWFDDLRARLEAVRPLPRSFR